MSNVTAFGAFVDIGVHQDGLVHISELADHYVKDPSAEVRVGRSSKSGCSMWMKSGSASRFPCVVKGA